MKITEFRKQVKEALEHIYDTSYLEVHPLLYQIAGVTTANRATRAQKLRSLLKESIEGLKPPEGMPSHSPEWRSYLVLRCRYVQGMTMGQVENELGLSRRQLQRETLKGLEALASILWTNHEIETLSISEQTSGVLLPDMENDIKQLETELNQWKLAWQVCELSTLINDVLWLLKPTLDQGQAEVQVDIPDTLAPVFVDTTLARQGLFMIMRLMVQNTHGIITLTATQEDKFMNIQVHSPSCFNNPHEDDWPMAQMIIHELGGSLSIESNSKIGFQLNIYLQLVGQKRVLVIDDNLAILQLFERYLAPHHYEVIKAVSGAEALMLLSESRPDVIILDVMMPNIDGWQVLRSLKQNPITTSTPVIICSVLKEPQLALSLGAQAYLKKPVDRLALLGTLEQLLSHLPPAGAKHPQEPLNN